MTTSIPISNRKGSPVVDTVSPERQHPQHASLPCHNAPAQARSYIVGVTLAVNTSHLSQKGGKTRQESSISGILPERKKKNPRSFRCTDYAKWMSMTRCVNR